MPHDSLHFPILKDLGLSETEAVIYELLLEMGPQKASDLVEPSGIARGNVYNVLMQLRSKGLILTKEGKQQIYEAIDPSGLRTLLEIKLRESERLQSAFRDALPKLVSTFNLSTGKPAVQIFEGLDGYKIALEDMLASKTEILTYMDASALKGSLAQLDSWYDAQRRKHRIHHRMLVADTEENRRLFQTGEHHLVEFRFVKDLSIGFQSAMEIYDNTITYFTLRSEKQIALIIKELSFYEMHKGHFEYLWAQAALRSTSTPSVDSTEGSSKTR